MFDTEEAKRLSRRKFLGKMATFGGLAIGGAITLAACGDPTVGAPAPAPSATTVPPITPTSPPTTAPAATPSAVATPTKKAGTSKATPTPASKNDANFVEVGPLTDFESVATEPKLVNLPKAKKPNAVFITKWGDNYQALSNICTHQGCEIDWSSADQLFECPCHGSRFDLSGDNVGGPAPLPLASFAVKVENGRLLVSMKRNN